MSGKLWNIFDNFMSTIPVCFVKSCSPYLCCTCFSSQNSDTKNKNVAGGASIKTDDIGARNNVVIHSPILQKGDQCMLCKKKKDDLVIVPCGHGQHCNSCLEKWYEAKNICPICNKPTIDVVQCL
tara:strand:+ start:358 stop:732 length:375 start_codon:yes stop_codon:yes gene_type:complete